MMRVLVQHAKRYKSCTFGTLSPANQTLQNRLTEALDHNAQIIPVLQQWRQQGNHINPCHVRDIIKKLRDSDQSLQALQVSEWMFDNVVEFKEVEKFFESIPQSVIDGSVYASVSDVRTAKEKLLTAWEENGGDWSTLEWLITLDMAKVCLKDGSQEKAIKLLTLTEKLFVDRKSFKQAYELLTKLHGEAEKKEEVLRIWNLCKKITEEYCDSNDYLTVIRSLLKLDAIAEAEEIYKVWESLPLEFDIRIPTMLASGYRERGMVDKAEKLIMKILLKHIRMKRPIKPLLDQWGSRMRVSELKCLIKNLRDSNQFSKALQVSEWMDEKKACNIYAEDYAARLHMVEVVLGLEEAEKFFKNIPENMKDDTVYATLLRSYTKSDKHLGKAKATFEKMRELGFLMRPSPFNSMLSFHRQRYMVEKFLREMEENNVAPDSLMVNKVLRIYAAESKVEAMETFMKKWSGEEGIKLERETMATVAKAYSKAGSLDKAIELYGGVEGSKKEVYRLWNECKKNEKLEDYWYKTVIASLLKLDDVEGAEKVYGEWKPVGLNLDLSIPGLLISRFCKEANESKVGELIISIKEKRNEMRLRMVRNLIVKVVTGVAICVGLICVVFINHMTSPVPRYHYYF
ncbi:Pentatricopeptide repeat-containing protein [Hirschfeldia incana]|nr:Pentatricopeptide repeat-containing protein [Hirschfeldia incana]